ncbi:MAG: acetyl-coenzyme A synthetase N-terminal domain-containing protein, partial [Cyclobacteriaceae bacterium]
MNNFQDYLAEYQQSITDPEKFWASQADNFVWKKKWNAVLQWDFHKAEVKWFIGGKLNITENCIDRHLPMRSNQTAILWESNDPKEPSRNITYQQLHDQVSKVGNMLKAQGVKKGDRVCIYMPMVPETAFAILGCARIGAVHSVV